MCYVDPLGAFPIITTRGQKRPAKSAELVLGKAEIWENPMTGFWGCRDKASVFITSSWTSPCPINIPARRARSSDLCFFLFSSSLGNLSMCHSFKYHLYAGNSQMCRSSLNISSNSDGHSTCDLSLHLESSLIDIWTQCSQRQAPDRPPDPHQTLPSTPPQ